MTKKRDRGVLPNAWPRSQESGRKLRHFCCQEVVHDVLETAANSRVAVAQWEQRRWEEKDISANVSACIQMVN